MASKDKANMSNDGRSIEIRRLGRVIKTIAVPPGASRGQLKVELTKQALSRGQTEVEMTPEVKKVVDNTSFFPQPGFRGLPDLMGD